MEQVIAGVAGLAFLFAAAWLLGQFLNCFAAVHECARLLESIDQRLKDVERNTDRGQTTLEYLLVLAIPLIAYCVIMAAWLAIQSD